VIDIGPPILDDGYRCFLLGHDALREKGVRLGKFPPLTAEEERWKAEGPRPVHQLDTALSGKPWER
jgi:hypothetical protein